MLDQHPRSFILGGISKAGFQQPMQVTVVKYVSTMLLVLGLLGLTFGFGSCRRLEGGWDETTDLAGLKRAQSSLVCIFWGAVAFSIGLYLRGKTPGVRNTSQLRADLTLLSARFCPKCNRAFRGADCKKTKLFGLISRWECPQCKAHLELFGAKIMAVGLALVLASFLPVLFINWPHMPDILMAISSLACPASLPVLAVGLMRLNRQPRIVQDYGSVKSESVTGKLLEGKIGPQNGGHP